jgi:hypothetical protein
MAQRRLQISMNLWDLPQIIQILDGAGLAFKGRASLEFAVGICWIFPIHTPSTELRATKLLEHMRQLEVGGKDPDPVFDVVEGDVSGDEGSGHQDIR